MKKWLWPSLIIFLLGSIVISLCVGSVHLTFAQVWEGLMGGEDSVFGLVLREIRIPRTLLAVLVGASLGLSGAAMQGFLRNPLAEPGLMGVSGGAAFGAVLAMYTGWSKIFPLALPLGGLSGAMIAVIIVYLLAGKQSSVYTLILAGIAINSLAGACTTLALNLSRNPHTVLEITFWLMGSMADRSFKHVFLAAPIMALGWILLLAATRALNALSLGEDTAQTLGFRMSLVRLQVIMGTALAVGASVAVSGTIAFVGLVVPHLLRPLVGGEPGKLLGVSALGGAILTLWADMGVRLLSEGTEIKLGVLTALIGAPFFLVMILKSRREMV